MHDASMNKMCAFVEKYLSDFADLPLEILDIGAQSVSDMETYRQLFDQAAWHYRGLDLAQGANVDVVVSDAYHWKEIEDASIDVVVSGQALEHVEFPWMTFMEISRILKPMGVACIIAPSSGPEHRYPLDCWRIYPDGMRALSRHAGLSAVEVFVDWGIGPWQDTFAVLQKCTSQGGETAGPFPKYEDRFAARTEYLKITGPHGVEPTYYIHAATLWSEQGDYSSSAAILREGLRHTPRNPMLRSALISALVKTGDMAEASKETQSLLGYAPVLPALVQAVGDVFECCDQETRSRLAESFPRGPEPLFKMAKLSFDKELLQLSAVCSEHLLKAGNLEKNVCLGMAKAWRRKGNSRLALQFYRRLLKRQIEEGEVNRTTILQRTINAINARVYLEIGVNRGYNFFQIEAPVKLAVDPSYEFLDCLPMESDGCRFFPMTSNDFFAAPPKELLDFGLDVVLIDGQHTYEQSLLDVIGCLRFLNPNGVIVMHDCLPASEAEAYPSFEEARLHPEFRAEWTGDVYRTIVHMRAFRADINVAVIDADHGLGIIRRGTPEAAVQISEEEIRNLSFMQLSRDKNLLLDLKPAEWADLLIDTISATFDSNKSTGVQP
jgi:SAM-dependent methyltransferase